MRGGPAPPSGYDAPMSAAPTFHVACLCAAWCRTCEGYQAVFEQAVSELAAAGVALRSRWGDIEDEADLVGDADVETFPTLLIADARDVRFAGPLTPQPDTLRRLLRAALVQAAADADRPAVAPEIEAFAQRLRGAH